jgi:hypothetical protein
MGLTLTSLINITSLTKQLVVEAGKMADNAADYLDTISGHMCSPGGAAHVCRHNNVGTDWLRRSQLPQSGNERGRGQMLF